MEKVADERSKEAGEVCEHQVGSSLVTRPKT